MGAKISHDMAVRSIFAHEVCDELISSVCFMISEFRRNHWFDVGYSGSWLVMAALRRSWRVRRSG